MSSKQRRVVIAVEVRKTKMSIGDALATCVFDRIRNFESDTSNEVRAVAIRTIARVFMSAEHIDKPFEVLIRGYAKKITADPKYRSIRRYFIKKIPVTIPILSIKPCLDYVLTSMILKNTPGVHAFDRTMVALMMTCELIEQALRSYDDDQCVTRAVRIYTTTFDILCSPMTKLDAMFIPSTEDLDRWILDIDNLLDPKRKCDICEGESSLSETEDDEPQEVIDSRVLLFTAVGPLAPTSLADQANNIDVNNPKKQQKRQNKIVLFPLNINASNEKSNTQLITIPPKLKAKKNVEVKSIKICRDVRSCHTDNSRHDFTLLKNLLCTYIISRLEITVEDSEVYLMYKKILEDNLVVNVNQEPIGALLQEYATKLKTVKEYPVIRKHFLAQFSSSYVADISPDHFQTVLHHFFIVNGKDGDDRIMMCIMMIAAVVENCLNAGNNENAVLITNAGINAMVENRVPQHLSLEPLYSWMQRRQQLIHPLRECFNLVNQCILPTIKRHSMLRSSLATNQRKMSTDDSRHRYDPRVTSEEIEALVLQNKEVLASYLSHRLPQCSKALFKEDSVDDLFSRAEGVAIKAFAEEVIDSAEYEDISQKYLLQLSKSATKADDFEAMILKHIIPPFNAILFENSIMVVLLTFELVSDSLDSGKTYEAIDIYNTAVRCFDRDSPRKDIIETFWKEMVRRSEALLNNTKFQLEYQSFQGNLISIEKKRNHQKGSRPGTPEK